MKKLLPGLLALFLVVGSASCTPAKKPAPNVTQKQKPSTVEKVTPAKKTSGTTAEQRMASRIAADVSKVNGVEKATVVVSGRTAFIGLTLRPNVEKSRTERIKSEVASRAKKVEPTLTRVNVTSDPNLVARIKRIADSVKSGKPVSGFASELAEIARRITPKMK